MSYKMDLLYSEEGSPWLCFIVSFKQQGPWMKFQSHSSIIYMWKHFLLSKSYIQQQSTVVVA